MELFDTIRLLFRKDKKPFLQLREILGFYPRNIRLYKLALKHKSVGYAQMDEQRSKGEAKRMKAKASLNNERLEFLGDAILGAIVADFLYQHYTTKQEGFLTTLRSKIVCRNSLNRLAVEIGLDKLILYSGNVTTAHNSYMNGNAFEAFLGAIYLDRGYSYCYKFLEKKILKTYINVDKLSTEEINHKSALIEWCQRYQYKVKFSNREMKENNVPKFHSEIQIEGIVCGAGEGYTKKESDQQAAEKALRRIKREATLKKKIAQAVEAKRLMAKQQSEHDKTVASIKGRKVVVFDLDGTLMDTLKDLYLSTNFALRECGYPERSLEEVRSFVGNGVQKLIERAMPDTGDQTAIDTCFAAFKKHYIEHCQDNTGLYEGIQDLLEALKERGYRLAIVSNKLQAGVSELYDVWFKDTVEVAIGESPEIQRKPAADMVNKALEKLHAEKSDAVYVGDSDVDLKTAENAGLPCISVLWGFRSKEFLLEHGAKVLVNTPQEILDILQTEKK